MVHAKPKRTRKTGEESDLETDSQEWDELLAESVAKASAAAKGKAPVSSKAKASPTAADKGKAPMESRLMRQKTGTRKRGSAQGIEIREPTEQMQGGRISSDRIKEFENKECIGERHVDVKALSGSFPGSVVLFAALPLLLSLPLVDLVGTPEFEVLPTGGGYWFTSGSHPHCCFSFFLPLFCRVLAAVADSVVAVSRRGSRELDPYLLLESSCIPFPGDP